VEPEGRLVGREAELGFLDRALGRLRRGYGSALAVFGEPGIGKTRFLSEAHQRAQLDEAVVAGSASEYEAAQSYGAFAAALDDYIRSVDRQVLAGLDDELNGVLAEILPSYPLTPSDVPKPAVDGQHRAHRAMRILLETLSVSKPHIVVLDDLHWADTATLAMVGALLRRPPTGPVLFLLAVRTRQAPPVLVSAVDQAVQSGFADLIELEPLTAPEARQLLGPGVSDTQAQSLYATSGGNPFYLEQLARMPLPGTRSPTDDLTRSAGGDLPPIVAAALTEELSSLGAAARRYLQGAAVAGDPFDTDLAAHAAAIAGQATGDALDELLERDMIRHADIPRRFRFRHPLLRRAVYETTPGGWRLTAHERCADALIARGASPRVLARHLEQAAVHGDQRAVAILTDAGRSVLAVSPIDAAHLLAAALRLTPTTPDPSQAVTLGATVAGAYASGGRFSDAHRTGLDALELVPDDQPEMYVQLATLCAAMEQLLGRNADAHARLTAALTRLPANPTPASADLFHNLALDSYYQFDIANMHSWACQARDAAVASGDEVQAIRNMSIAALAEALDGRIDVARRTRAQAARLAAAISADRFAEHPEHLTHLGIAEIHLDEYRAASAHIEGSLDIARSAGRGQFVPMLYWGGVARYAQGALAGALDLLDTAVEIARVAEHGPGIAWNLSARALVTNAMGDRAGALATAQEALERTRELSSALPAVPARLSYAAVLTDVGHYDQALAELRRPIGTVSPRPLPLRLQPDWYELIAHCLAGLAQLAEAANAATQAHDAAAELGLPTARAAAHRATAAVALADGDPSRAQTHARAAIEAFDEAGVELQADRTRILLGRALAACGQRDQAIEHLTAAAGRLEARLAIGWRSNAERTLRQLGHRRHRRSEPARRDGTELATLTGREREVVTLAAGGMTNPQIAAELFLSTKTVETHLRNAFHKLHVTSRLELARFMPPSERR